MTETLDDFRQEIDRIDSELLRLLAARFAITEKVGVYKQRHHLPAIDPAREELLFAKIRSLAKTENMDPDIAQRVFRSIVDESVRRHNEIKSESI